MNAQHFEYLYQDLAINSLIQLVLNIWVTCGSYRQEITEKPLMRMQ